MKRMERVFTKQKHVSPLKHLPASLSTLFTEYAKIYDQMEGGLLPYMGSLTRFSITL
jgi:hypothetical protein